MSCDVSSQDNIVFWSWRKFRISFLVVDRYWKMIPKYARLVTSGARVALLRWNKRHARCFSFSYIKQRYVKRHQCGVHFAKKVHKSAVVRNIAKRAIFAAYEELLWSYTGTEYYKIFINVNKRQMEELASVIAKTPKSAIYELVYGYALRDIRSFFAFLS